MLWCGKVSSVGGGDSQAGVEAQAACSGCRLCTPHHWELGIAASSLLSKLVLCGTSRAQEVLWALCMLPAHLGWDSVCHQAGT